MVMVEEDLEKANGCHGDLQGTVRSGIVLVIALWCVEDVRYRRCGR